MADDDNGIARQRLYYAVARWHAGAGYGLADLIHAAGEALADGLDSPALRRLATSPATSLATSSTALTAPSTDVRTLVSASLAELQIPYPGTAPPGFAVTAGRLSRRAGIDTLRLEVAPTPDNAGGGLQVQVYVNGVEMTSAAAGLGMDPYDILFPANRLVADAKPHTVPIARCHCGVYGCNATDVTITRDGDVVHWDWSINVPMNRGVSFAARHYDAEVARAASDCPWNQQAS